MGCFTWLILIGGFIFVMVTLLRWFEQITDAVDEASWNKVAFLIAVPFAAWAYESRSSAGRPGPVPLHEPVRGFGLPSSTRAKPSPPSQDQPPPGTPPEFLGMPKIPPPRPKSAKPALDPEKIAKLRQKMREQGMLGPDEE
jgi:hypothetical protein